MCGIFGIIKTAQSSLSAAATETALERLFILSESRGKESAGIHAALPATNQQWTLKSAVAARQFITSASYRSLMQALSQPQTQPTPTIVMAHSRLVTNGKAALEANNQPVARDGVTIVHNGIIVNSEWLWQQHPQWQRHAQVDTEFAATMLADATHQGTTALDATKRFFDAMRGSASIAWVNDAGSHVTLATNTGDLYYTVIPTLDCLVFASERYILSQVIDALNLLPHTCEIIWLKPNHLLSIDPQTLALSHDVWEQPNHHAREVIQNFPVLLEKPANESLLRYNEKSLADLKRCTQCILPETFPFIHFNDKGVCNYCENYVPKYKDKDNARTKREFINSLQRFKRGKGEPDTIVAFSGGRDSSYGLHLIKKEFGLTPVTFTYDWGMVTDLARRNIARMCGQLGIQNILVSADIQKKRANIRRNVAAWLAKPDLGTVPLFMAGDKHFFVVTNQLKAQTGIDLNLWATNLLENTDFKSGFCGIAPDFEKHAVEYLSLSRKLQMVRYYAKAFLQNPRYLNRSLADTFTAFLSYYVEPRRDYHVIFHHMMWDEKEVNDVLLNQYDWEISPDSPSTWRIGDGTAPFYNYIYVTANGFSEFDTFRSNQIREGMITREEALQNILVENRPRIESLRWYLETIGLDFNSTIERINQLDWRGLHAA